jgi:hypothetical protein
MPARAQRRQSKRRLDFFSLRPIVIRVAFKAPRLRMFRPRSVARFASRDPRQEQVASLRAAQRFFVTARTRKSAVRIMIESRMRHPFHSRSRRFDHRQIILPRSNRERMTLFASLPPQKLLSIVGPRSNPLIRRIHSHSHLHRPPRQITPRLSRFVQLPRMRGDILAEFLYKKRVYHLRLIVRHTFIEPLVERQRMTTRASVREFHRRHQFTATLVPRTWKRPRFESERPIQRRVTGVSRCVVRVGVLPIRRNTLGLMTISAIQLHVRPVRSSPDRFHVNRVIHPNRSKIAGIVGQRGKFRMPVLQTRNMRRVIRRAAASFQIPVALRASLVLRRNNIHSPAVFGVARRATKCIRLRSVVHRPIVARQTSRIAGLRRKHARRLHVARRTVSLQHRVRLAHSPARIHPRVPRKSVPANPNQRDRRQPHAQPKLRALQRRRPLEIIQVDPLRQLLGCPCSSHSFTQNEAEGSLAPRHFFKSAAP